VEYAIAVFDVGKTNKKVLIYDPELTIVDSAFQSFPTEQRDGLEVEPIEAIEEWLLERLREFAEQYPIRAISVATHGACSVGVGTDGRPSLPVISYTHEPNPQLHDQFFRRVGAPADLQQETATIDIRPLVNVGKELFFLQKSCPDAFANTRSIIMYPQYFGYFLTGEVAAEPTYVGCHSFLWDFRKGDWSHVVDELGVRSMLPSSLKRPYDVLGTVTEEVAQKTGLDPNTIVTVGIHDSNAALLPYLLTKQETELTLNSTGTWCVAMHPMEDVYFEENEIGKSVFYNLSAFGTPVKTSILLGGLEFETYTEILSQMHGTDEQPPFDPEFYSRVLREANAFILPSVVQGTGQFPHSAPRVIEDGQEYPLQGIKDGASVPPLFSDRARAYAVLNISIAIQSRIALERVGTPTEGTIYVEGGFRKNRDYMALLAAMFPNAAIATTDMEEATAFGAALLAKSAQEGREIQSLSDSFEIHAEAVEPASFSGVDAYMEQFIAHLG
jgi:sugar (pentulose or hexulose) kinase